jgi:hypothetical protein
MAAPALAPASSPKSAIAMTARRVIVPLTPAGTEMARTWVSSQNINSSNSSHIFVAKNNAFISARWYARVVLLRHAQSLPRMQHHSCCCCCWLLTDAVKRAKQQQNNLLIILELLVASATAGGAYATVSQTRIGSEHSQYTVCGKSFCQIQL